MQLQHDKPPAARALSGEHVGDLLGRWQRRELRRASRFGECGGLTREDLEDLYQDSVLALLERAFESEQHLRWALHEALKHRALNAHRNRTRRARIAEYAHNGQEALERAAEVEQASDQPVLAQQDEFIVREFLAELTEQEGHVFRLLADGHGWRGAADALGAPRNEVRAAARSCERKRERFALLYTTGRLCGYRAHTIEALNSGESDSGVLARRAHAHLQACARCRIEHGTNGERFRRLFDRDALALLPLPVLAQRLPLLSRIAGRAHRVVQHLAGPLTGSGGAGAKLAVGVASIAVAAGGTIGATQALSRHPAQPLHRHAHSNRAPARAAVITTQQTSSITTTATTPPAQASHPSPRHSKALTEPSSAASTSSTTTTSTETSTSSSSATAPATAPASTAPPLTPVSSTPGGSAASGFAYLGVPQSTLTGGATIGRTSKPTGQGGSFSP
jgi:DNA-directed RNA polymerase specialized sigma24 family protein